MLPMAMTRSFGCGQWGLLQEASPSSLRSQGSNGLQSRLLQSVQARAARSTNASQPIAQLQHSNAVGPRSTSSAAQPAPVQQPLSGLSVLEQSAAAPRSTALPEPLQASTSSSSSSSTYSSSRRRRVTVSASSRRNHHDLDTSVHSSSMHHRTELPQTRAAVAAAAAAAQIGSTMSAGHTDCSSNSFRPDSRNISSSEHLQDKRLTDEGHQLMQDIVLHTNSWQDLAQLIERQASNCTAPHCAAALYRLAELWQQQEQHVLQHEPQSRGELRLQYPTVLKLAGVLLKALQQQLAAARLRDLADALHALVNLGLRLQAGVVPGQEVGNGSGTGHPGSNSGRKVVQQQQQQQQDDVSASVSAGVIPAGFIVALLQHSHAQVLTGDCKPRPLGRLLWGLAQPGINPSADWWAGVLESSADTLQQQQQRQQQQDNMQSHQQWQLDAILHLDDQLHDYFSPQGLALTGWAVAKLQAPASDAWWACYTAAAAPLLQHMEPQHLSNCIWALATVHHVPNSDWMGRFYEASGSYLLTAGFSAGSPGVLEGLDIHEGFTAQGFANVLWALAVLQQQPPEHWQQEFEAASAAELPQFSMQHLSMTLWAYGKMSSGGRGLALQQQQQQGSEQVHHGQQQQQGLQQPQQQQGQQQPRQQQHGLQQQQRQQRRPSEAWLDQFWVQLSRVEAKATAQSVACLLWAIIQIGVVVPEQRLQQLERLVCEVVRDAEPQGLAVMVWGLAVIRGKDTNRTVIKRVRSYLRSNQQQLADSMAPQGLVMLLYGFSRFNAWQPGWLKRQLRAAVQRTLQLEPRGCSSSSISCGNSVSCSNGLEQKLGFQACELPVVLLSLVQLQMELPTDLLQQAEALLLLPQQQLQQQQQRSLQGPYQQQQQLQDHMQLDGLSTKQLSVCLFALGLAKHLPSTGFMQAAVARVQQRVSAMGPKDVAFVLFGLAAMSSTTDDQQQQQQQQLLKQLVQQAQKVLPAMDQACLAMVMWSLVKLQHKPSEQFLQQILAATTAQLPNMTLLSVTSILAALQALEYLPPLPWMIETCKAARAKVSSDPSPQPWQRRVCVRRLEETVSWVNSVVQQQQQQHGASSRAADQDPGTKGVQRRVAGAVLKGAAGVLGAGNTSSEAIIAAAVGVAAAVAQQWRW